MSAVNEDVLHAPHTVEYTYTRSTGLAIGAYLTGLREGKIIGSVGSDGRILVPATDYDPITAADLSERVEVAHTGTVTTWAWVSVARPGQPLDRPFAWALVQLDGTDVAFLAAVDAGSDEAMSTGARVSARFREGAIGVAGDLYFVLKEDA